MTRVTALGGMPAADVEAIDREQWLASVATTLARGRDLTPEQLAARFDSVLTTQLEDGITLQPLYTASDTPGGAASMPPRPGRHPFTRGTNAAGKGWSIRQRIEWRGSASDTAPLLAEEVAGGSDGVWLDLSTGRGDAPPSTAQALHEAMAGALAGVDLTTTAVTLSAPGDAASATALAGALEQLWSDAGVSPPSTSGCLGLDPYGWVARHGELAGIDEQLRAAARMARSLADAGTPTRALVCDGTIYHEAGATAAEEMALAVATGVSYLRDLLEAGLTAAQAVAQLEFRFSATDDQFVTIAKLRAARRLWARVTEVAGLPSTGVGQVQHAVTSAAMQSRYDPWVNLLRGTVACFAAGVGGAQSITVRAHDEVAGNPGTDLARRMARNTQLVLAAESHLDHVTDPGGGSYYLESLTDQLAHAAWEYLQQIESSGGVLPVLRSGAVAERIAASRQARAVRVAHRRQPLTGVSEFPLLSDTPLPPSPHGPGSTDDSAALRPRRYAEAFEALRDRSRAHEEATGDRPRVFLATLGTVAHHTARAGFMRNLLAAGGIAAQDTAAVSSTPTEEHPPSDPSGLAQPTAEQVAEAFARSGATVACLCGSDEDYRELAVPTAAALAAREPARVLIAGGPEDMAEPLAEAGVSQSVHAGDDALALLQDILDALEVA
jgi:methylmalonyl-CoA mutase